MPWKQQYHNNTMPSWWPQTQLERLFFFSTGTQGLVNVVIQIVILIVYLDWVNPPVYEVPLAYITPLTLAVTTLGCLFQTLITLDAYRIKNNVQIFTQCVFNTCLSVATIFQYIFIRDANTRILKGYNMYFLPFAKNDRNFWLHVSPALIVCIIVSCLCSVAMFVLAFALHREYAWAIYQHITPDKNFRYRYLTYQIYLVILKFSPFFLVAFIVTYDLIDVHYEEPEFSLTMAIIPVALIHVGLAVYVVRRESTVGMAGILFIHAAEMAYFINRLVVLHGTSIRANTDLKEQMVFYAVAALVFSTAAFGVGCACFMNFGKGLRPVLLSQVQRIEPTTEPSDTQYFHNLDDGGMLGSERGSRRFLLD
ncbi:hypothetical protein IQ07DRAFT_146909 [Pyrenochaeta sp. DS3sAY3a]|nr:hypothetical protein IQ07DRAFT_146909 [Pyrenochaeta sp. DS3sAY3a]